MLYLYQYAATLGADVLLLHCAVHVIVACAKPTCFWVCMQVMQSLDHLVSDIEHARTFAE